MPTELDPAWEYWDGGDPEVRELLDAAVGHAAGFSALGLERDGERSLSSDYNHGFRFGRGDPNTDHFIRLGRAKPGRKKSSVLAVPCRRCGVTFLPDRNGRRFCSVACVPRPGRPREFADRECGTCRAAFRPLYSSQTFCSRACFSSRTREEVAAVLARCAGGGGGPACPVCGGEVPESRSRSKNKIVKKYCSPACKRKLVRFRYYYKQRGG